ncbi:MAM and LDL-receptor class A domain-containing protein 1-like [Lytechinus variegatus]|uniref:MAM and LDL-receptor class A domain-containing protein 1-like n=1 Tax=Lytechinus variegatus TaxID=7654 RepID=UPI001BB28FB6|nr:MAM and LDL-receptor class A domain-containing protein 1-like [Lytechinus variegatus]
MPNKCDFENGDCNYSPGAGTDFFWTVVQANSGDPVPSKDVSYNSGAGHMIFADMSSVQSNDQLGIVETGLLDPTDDNGRCFQFWYHLGTSRVAILKVSFQRVGYTLHSLFGYRRGSTH